MEARFLFDQTLAAPGAIERTGFVDLLRNPTVMVGRVHWVVPSHGAGHAHEIERPILPAASTSISNLNSVAKSVSLQASNSEHAHTQR